MNRRHAFHAATIVLAAASVAQANAGTPLMWATMLHLMIGNLFIGLMEGLLLARLFRLPKAKTGALLVVANYFSAWSGLFLLNVVAEVLPTNLNNARPLFWLLVLIAFLVTLLLELPFVAFAFGRMHQWLRKSLLASVVVQTASYVLLFGWYWSASGTSLLTDLQVVPPGSISVPNNIAIYYISAEDGDVYNRPLSKPGSRAIFDLNAGHRNDRLIVWPSRADEGRWDLVARLELEPHGHRHYEPIRESFASVAVSEEWDKDPESAHNTWDNFGAVPRLGHAQTSSWEFRTGFWAVEGVYGTNRTTGAQIGFCFETPLAAWCIRNATHLPGDKLLLQLGEDQICLYDPLNKQIALLAYGRGPIAVIHEPAAGPERIPGRLPPPTSAPE